MNRSFRRRNGWLVLLCLLGTSAAAAQEGADEQQGTGTERQLQRYADASIRFGFGGFRDNRSPDGDVGGSQIALDIRPIKLPITFALSVENYTKGRNPSQPYEIRQMLSASALYSHRLPAFDRAKVFIGGGAGRLKVPGGDVVAGTVTSNAYTLETGINVLVWRKLGLYALVKYLKAEKSVNAEPMIDFSETIWLFGLSYDFYI